MRSHRDLLIFTVILVAVIPSFGQTAEGYYSHGQAAEKGLCARCSRAAIDDFTKAIKLKPDFAEAYEARGQARFSEAGYNGFGYAEFSNMDKAIADFTKAIKLRPAFAEAYRHRAEVRALKRDYTGDLSESIADIDKAIQLDPNYADAYEYRGFLRDRLNDINGALADHTKALQLDPSSREARLGVKIAQQRLAALPAKEDGAGQRRRDDYPNPGPSSPRGDCNSAKPGFDKIPVGSDLGLLGQLYGSPLRDEQGPSGYVVRTYVLYGGCSLEFHVNAGKITSKRWRQDRPSATTFRDYAGASLPREQRAVVELVGLFGDVDGENTHCSGGLIRGEQYPSTVAGCFQVEKIDLLPGTHTLRLWPTAVLRTGGPVTATISAAAGKTYTVTLVTGPARSGYLFEGAPLSWVANWSAEVREKR
jgi:hypothetical protein